MVRSKQERVLYEMLGKHKAEAFLSSQHAAFLEIFKHFVSGEVRTSQINGFRVSYDAHGRICQMNGKSVQYDKQTGLACLINGSSVQYSGNRLSRLNRKPVGYQGRITEINGFKVSYDGFDRVCELNGHPVKYNNLGFIDEINGRSVSYKDGLVECINGKNVWYERGSSSKQQDPVYLMMILGK